MTVRAVRSPRVEAVFAARAKRKATEEARRKRVAQVKRELAGLDLKPYFGTKKAIVEQALEILARGTLAAFPDGPNWGPEIERLRALAKKGLPNG